MQYSSKASSERRYGKSRSPTRAPDQTLMRLVRPDPNRNHIDLLQTSSQALLFREISTRHEYDELCFLVIVAGCCTLPYAKI